MTSACAPATAKAANASTTLIKSSHEWAVRVIARINVILSSNTQPWDLHNPAASCAAEHSDFLFVWGGAALSVRGAIDGTGAALVGGGGAALSVRGAIDGTGAALVGGGGAAVSVRGGIDGTAAALVGGGAAAVSVRGGIDGTAAALVGGLCLGETVPDVDTGSSGDDFSLVVVEGDLTRIQKRSNAPTPAIAVLNRSVEAFLSDCGGAGPFWAGPFCCPGRSAPSTGTPSSGVLRVSLSADSAF